MTTTVVVPHYNQHRQLARTLTALDRQVGSPALQVIVVDDGSSTPVRPPTVEFDLVLLSQRRDGFGLARARNLGAQRADGELLVFLDADMVPVPGFVAAHTAAVSDEFDVSIGHRLHGDVDALADEEVEQFLAGRASAEQLRRVGPLKEPGWRADHLERTDDLRDPFSWGHRIASGGNLALHRAFYWEVGGTDPRFRQWGGEDFEFAFRASTHGATFKYTRAALAYHSVDGAVTAPSERQSQAEQRPVLVNRVPDPALRSGVRGRVHEVPMVEIALSIDGEAVAEAEAVIDDLLTYSAGVRVTVVDLVDDRDRLILSRAFPADPRVLLEPVEAHDVVGTRAPFQAALRVSGRPTAAVVARAVERLLSPPAVGLVRLGLAGAVHPTGLAARELRSNPGTDYETLISLLARIHGVVDLPMDVIEQAGGPVVADDAHALRELWWSLTPSQRRFAERAVALVRRARRRATRQQRGSS